MFMLDGEGVFMLDRAKYLCWSTANANTTSLRGTDKSLA